MIDDTTLLVSTQWLAEHLYDSNLRVIDIRGRVLPASEPLPHYFSHHADYLESHIPGAVFVDWTTDIVEPGSPSYDVAGSGRYAALMSRLGVGDNTQVVAYDDANGMFAARLWWTLHYYGHTQAAVLNGGWQKWLAEGYPTSAEQPQIAATTFMPRPNPALRRSAADILAEQPQLLDVRSVAEYNGEVSRAQRAGRIPGALNLPRKRLLAADGTLLVAEALREAFNEAGLKLDAPETVLYCNSGVSASFVLLALRRAGVPTGSLYDGSWKDWANNPTYPIE